MWTAPERETTKREGFEGFLDKSIDRHGFWLKNHRNIIQDYLEVYRDNGWSWDTIQADLKNFDSPLLKNVYKLIDLARKEAYKVYGKDVTDLDYIDQLECTSRALDQLDD